MVDEVLLEHEAVGATAVLELQALAVVPDRIGEAHCFIARAVPDRDVRPIHTITPTAPR